MISFVKGLVAFSDSENIVLDNHGIGYRIRAVSRACAKAGAGDEMMLYTHFYVREDTMALYGFETMEELSVFRLMLGISGIGPKVAMSVLSSLTVEELYFAVFSDDFKTLTKTPGLGAKGAKRMIMELKDKLKLQDLESVSQLGADGHEPAVTGTDVVNTDQMSDAIEALMALGYSGSDAYKAVHKVPGAGDMDAGMLLKKALKVISSGV